MVTKRPHYVPQVYFSAWANADGQVSCRRRGGRAFTPHVRNIGVQGGIYGAGEPAEAREKMFGDLEGEWPSLRRELINHGNLGGRRRQMIAIFAAMQFSRTQSHLANANFLQSLAASTSERPISAETVRGYLQDLDGAEPEPNEVEALSDLVNGMLTTVGTLPTAEEVLSQSIDSAITLIAPILENKHWRVERFPNPTLLTSDRPVMLWNRSTQDSPLVGVGIANADQVRLPLSPKAMLVMSRDSGSNAALRPTRIRAVKSDICKQAYEFIVGTPNAAPELDRLSLAERSPRLRFAEGPGQVITEDGDTVPIGDILHSYVE